MIIVTAMLACGTLYQLADRYLIEHVEIVLADTIVAGEAATAAGSTALSGSTKASSEESAEDSTMVSEENSSNAAGIDTNALYDEWSYKSSDMSISIEKVVTGSGSQQITYYAADVQVKDASQLQAAFAKNSFGTNIVEPTSDIAAAHEAVFAVNGDYYGFRSDGVVIRNGILYRNEPAREAAVLYADGTMASFDESEISAETLLEQGALQTLSFGPALVKEGKAVEYFNNVKIDTNFGNRSISNANPRTGIGMIAPNHYVFVVVDGRTDESRGMTLEEFAQLFAELGVTEAYNLDGGGSSTMYFMGRVVNNPAARQGERGVSDILYLGERKVDMTMLIPSYEPDHRLMELVERDPPAANPDRLQLEFRAEQHKIRTQAGL